MSNLKLVTHNAEQTQKFGTAIGKLAEPGDIYLLIGDLGLVKPALRRESPTVWISTNTR